MRSSAVCCALSTVSGSVARVIYRSDSNGYTVLKVRLNASLRRQKHAKRSAVVVGECPAVVEGEYVKATGHWDVSTRFGMQLKASSIEAVLPTSTAGAEVYLRNFKGIGPAYAKRIVQSFPEENVFEVMEREPRRLLSVSGIGRAKLKLLLEEWRSRKVRHDALLMMRGAGIGPALAERIIDDYGSSAMDVVQNSPYSLVAPNGITFEHADRLASDFGLEKTDSGRLRAALLQQLERLCHDKGHTAVQEEQLLEATQAALGGVTRELLEQALQAEVESHRLVRDADTWIMSRAVREAEESVVRSVRTLMQTRHPLPFVSPDSMVRWLERSSSMQLASLQAAAVRDALTHKLLIITGGPGVGKTTTIASIVKVFRHLKIRCTLAAPTGRASARLSEVSGQKARTIHRLLDYDPDSGGFRRNERNPLHGQLFLIDEVSMMDVQLAAAFFEAIPPRAVVILVGDVNQLPSVAPGNFLQDLVSSGVVPCVRLTQIFRQKNQGEHSIVQAAHNVVQGRMPKLKAYHDGLAKATSLASYHEEGDFRFVASGDRSDTIDKISKLLKMLPRRFGLDAMEDVQVLTPMRRGLLGSWNLNHLIQKELNPSAALSSSPSPPPQRAPQSEMRAFGNYSYRVGDKVMQIINDYQKNVFNGEIGRIAAVSENGALMAVAYPEDLSAVDGEEDEAVPVVADEGDDADEAGGNDDHHNDGNEEEQQQQQQPRNVKRSPAPQADVVIDGRKVEVYRKRIVTYSVEELTEILPSYACTIHKSQGCEFPVVIIPMHAEHTRMLDPNLLYTGITRSRKLTILVGSKTAIANAVKNESVRKRDTLLAKRLAEANQ